MSSRRTKSRRTVHVQILLSTHSPPVNPPPGSYSQRLRALPGDSGCMEPPKHTWAMFTAKSTNITLLGCLEISRTPFSDAWGNRWHWNETGTDSMQSKDVNPCIISPKIMKELGEMSQRTEKPALPVREPAEFLFPELLGMAPNVKKNNNNKSKS